MKNILITGAAGFIGTNLVAKLLENKDYYIVGVDNLNPYYNPLIKDENVKANKNPRFAFYPIDVTNKYMMTTRIFDKYKFDTVIHLAAQAGVGYSIDNSQEVLTNNIIGFDILAKESIRQGVKHFIYASSSSVYGDDGTQKSPYAVSKATNELQAAMYSNLYDMKFTGLRFFTVYGKGIRQDLAICKFIKAMKNNEPIHIYGDGTQSRDFTYVDDITEAITLILESDKVWKNEVFDIGYGRTTTVNELVSVLKEIVNPSFDKIIYEDKKPYDVETTLANPNKLYEWFGFKPRYSIKEGLEKWQQ